MNMWLTLVLSLPTENATARMRAWRALKASGAAVLRDGVYLLPKREACHRVLFAVASDVQSAGGSAHLLNVVAEEGAAYEPLFDRSDDYAALLAETGAARLALAADTALETLKQARKLRKGLTALTEIDFFPGEAKRQAEAAVAELEDLTHRVLSPNEPRARPGEIVRLAAADYRNRRWATRARPWVDRLACAWLIRRHIDARATFLWLAQPDDCPPDAIGFDFDGATFSHVGAKVTFEVLLAAFGLERPALMRLGVLVHFLDVGGVEPPEASGVERVMAGLREAITDDDQLMLVASGVFEGLQVAFETEVGDMNTRENSPTDADGIDAPAAPRPVGFGEALAFWLKLGFISFGGPAGQIAIMHTELVERRRWISERRFLHALNFCMVLPGPEAQQLATYLGWLMHRTRGGIAAGALFVLPSLGILIGLSWVYVAFGQVPLVAGIFFGLKPAVAALVVHAAHRIGSRALKSRWLWAIAAAAFIAIFAFDVPFPLIVLAAGAVGFLGGRHAQAVFAAGGGHAAAHASYGPALIDDDTPTPPHARFTRGRFVRVLAIGLGLWAAAMGVLVASVGVDGTLAQMGWFFTKAALLTFGGAYAVLPYVYQGAVEQQHWLGGAQMIDGLALGETTPGPLIMVVAFVAFVGGWGRQVLGPDVLFLGAALAAGVVTFFTFLPSFVFILAGGPVVESTHGNLKFTAPLTAITAAVVGVILNLALFFAYHVLWPQGLHGPFSASSALITAMAAIALFRFKVGVMPLLAGCAVAGLLVTFVSPLVR